MHKKTYFVMMLTLLLGSMLTATYILRKAEASPETSLRIDPSNIIDPTLTPGSSFTVDVVVADVEHLFAWQVNLTFNSNVLRFVNVTEGEFLASQPEGTYSAIHIEERWVLFGWSTQGPYIGVSGSGTLATVAFEVLAEGESLLDFEEDLIYHPRTDTYHYMTYLVLQTNSTPPPNWIYLYPPDLTIQDGYFNNLGAPPFPETLDELIAEVTELGSEGAITNQGIARSLIAKLTVAQRLASKGRNHQAKRILEAGFIPQVQNLSGIHITVEAADLLIESAEHLISHL
jgi:hypothetical protein